MWITGKEIFCATRGFGYVAWGLSGTSVCELHKKQIHFFEQKFQILPKILREKGEIPKYFCVLCIQSIDVSFLTPPVKSCKVKYYVEANLFSSNAIKFKKQVQQ